MAPTAPCKGRIKFISLVTEPILDDCLAMLPVTSYTSQGVPNEAVGACVHSRSLFPVVTTLRARMNLVAARVGHWATAALFVWVYLAYK